MRITMIGFGHIVQLENTKFVHFKPIYESRLRICGDICGYLIRYPLTPLQKESGEKIISKL